VSTCNRKRTALYFCSVTCWDAHLPTVFVRAGTTWTLEATLLARDSGASDQLGYDVNLSADGTRALLGAPTDDTVVGADRGTARLFALTADGWREQQTLTDETGAERDFFGVEVALRADGRLAFVAAYVGGPEHAGRVHLFEVTPAHELGVRCTAADECVSDFCVDGVCCEAECGNGRTDDCWGCTAETTGAPYGTCSPAVLLPMCRPDAWIRPDASAPDAGRSLDGGPAGSDRAGCSCGVAGRGETGSWIAFLIAGLAVLSRRRRARAVPCKSAADPGDRPRPLVKDAGKPTCESRKSSRRSPTTESSRRSFDP
jgi:hypothetical protein